MNITGSHGFRALFRAYDVPRSTNYPADAYDKIMTEMGADANAYTSNDLTCYHLNVAAEDLETVMKLESDRFKIWLTASRLLKPSRCHLWRISQEAFPIRGST